MTASRHSAQVPPFAERHEFLASLHGGPWRPFGASCDGRPLVYAASEPRSRTAPRATLLVAGAIHGDEPASAVTAARFYAAVATPAAGDVPGASTGAQRERVLVVPVVNPDGFAAHTKDNARGVDLNRNFPTRNHGERPRPGYAPGPAPASEPETQALLALIAGEGVTRIVALHQPLACVNFDGPAADWAQAVAAACGLPTRADVGYPTPGSMGTYFGVERQVPILTLELGRETPDMEWPRALAALQAAWKWKSRL